MAEACTVSHVESRRSLPAWMLKSCSGIEVAKTEDRNKLALESNVQIRSLDQTSPVKRKTVRQLKNVDSEGSGGHRVLQPCGGREKTRRASKDAVKKELEEVEKVTVNNPIKASARAAPKNSRKRKLENVIKSESPSPGTSDDEIELTVEDLISIAEEYVNADKRNQQGLETMKPARCKERPTCSTVSADADTGGKVVNHRLMKGLFQCTTVTTNTRPSEHQEEEGKSRQELQCSSSFDSTRDVAEEMLKLFLGPLYSKPAGCGKSEYIESLTGTANHLPGHGNKSEHLESTTSAVNHLPEKKDLHCQLPREGEPVAKKKSSLKDKVALLFD